MTRFADRSGSVRNALGERIPRDLESVVDEMEDALEPSERVMRAVVGSWRHSKKCAVVLTSRQVLVGGGDVVQAYPLDSVRNTRLQERWRTADLAIQMLGLVADIDGIPLDDAREMARLIETGVRLRALHEPPQHGVPGR